MSSLFGGKKQQPQPLPPPPSPDTSADVRRRMEEASALQRKARGRASTILTSPQGILNEDSPSQRILLGS